MSLINFTGFESGSLTEVFSSTGTVSVTNSLSHTGSYCLRSNPVGTAYGNVSLSGISASGTNTAFSSANVYFSFWFQYAIKPASGSEIIAAASNSTSNSLISLRLNSTGNLSLYNEGFNSTAATGTATLNANTWYRISGLLSTANWPNNPYLIKVNGVTDMSGVANLTTATLTNFTLGKSAPTFSAGTNTVDFYYDDVILDNAIEPAAATVVGVTHPSANGSTMSWTAGTAPSDYTRINQVVPQTTTYIMTPLTVNNLALFSIQSMGSIGLSGGTFLAIKAMGVRSENISVTSSNVGRVVSGSSTTNTTAINLTTTPTLISQILDTDPATATTWTEAGINAIQFGSLEANAVAVRMSWGAVGILYQSGTPPNGLTTSDTINTSENVQVSLTNTLINVSDTPTTSESTIVNQVTAGTALVTKSDATSLSENVSVALQSPTTATVNVTDTTASTESLSLTVSTTTPLIASNDSTSLSEAVSVFIPTFLIKVSDSTTTSEAAFVTNNALPIVVNDSTSTSEFINIVTSTTIPSINVSDTVTTTESKAFNLPVNLSVSDSITTNESQTAAVIPVGAKSVTVAESVTTSESVQLKIPTLFLQVSETISTAEFIFALGPNTLPSAPIPPRHVQPFSGGERHLPGTKIEILDSNLNVVTWVKTPLPLNAAGTILRYSKELSDFGLCTFRISSYDPAFTALGDIVTPHKYHIRIVRDQAVVWQGAIIENTKRTKDFIEVVAAEYVWYLGKKLIARTSNNPNGGGADDIYRIFESGTMAAAVTSVMTQTLTAFATSNHALASLKLGTIENPNYPPNMTNGNNSILSGPWSFGDGITAPRLTYDFHTVLYVLKSFGAYTYADFNIDAGLNFNFKKFLGNDHHYDLSFVWGRHGNITDFNVIRLGERMVNHLWGIAVDSTGKILHHDVTDQPSISTSGILEQVAAYADIKDQGSLNARIDAELPLISTSNAAAITISLNQKSYPLGMYDIGDIVNIKVNHIAIQYEQIRRIVGITVDLKSMGRENVTLQLNVPRPFQYGSAP